MRRIVTILYRALLFYGHIKSWKTRPDARVVAYEYKCVRKSIKPDVQVFLEKLKTFHRQNFFNIKLEFRCRERFADKILLRHVGQSGWLRRT